MIYIDQKEKKRHRGGQFTIKGLIWQGSKLFGSQMVSHMIVFMALQAVSKLSEGELRMTDLLCARS